MATEAYVYNRTALFRDNAPLSAVGMASVDGFVISGIEPSGTKRRVVFAHVDSATLAEKETNTTASTTEEETPVYYKLTVDSDGKATEEAVTTQDITADSVLEEGNTVAELNSIKSIPDFVGKNVYPVIAFFAPETATTVPTMKLAIKATSAEETFEKEEESQIYQLAASPVTIISIEANVKTTGKGTAVVTARFYNGTWTDYIDLKNVTSIKASMMQFKAKYTVAAIDSDTAAVTDATVVYAASMAKVSGSTAEIITRTMHFAEETGGKGVSYAQALIKHKKFMDADIKAYASFRTEPKTREMIALGTGTGASQTYTLSDTGINHNSIVVQVNGVPYYGFSYNTETNEITVAAEKNAAVTASYEYDWGDEEWKDMTLVSRQVYGEDADVYASRFQYTIPSTDTDKTVSCIKFALIRPTGDVTEETLGTGTGDTQVFKLPHFARKDTIVCNGTWSYNDDTRVLTVIADKGTDIKISYHWVAESHEVYGVTAGWAEEQ